MRKLQERRLWRYGHVIRANENSLAKIGMNIKVDGKQPKGRRNNGGLIHWMEISKPRDSIQIRSLIEQNSTADHGKPKPLVKGAKAKEK